jgi:hypothetical protein
VRNERQTVDGRERLAGRIRRGRGAQPFEHGSRDLDIVGGARITLVGDRQRIDAGRRREGGEGPQTADALRLLRRAGLGQGLGGLRRR